MKEEISFFIFVTILFVIFMYTGTIIGRIKDNQEIKITNPLFKDIIEIKEGCSLEVSTLIKEKLIDNKLTHKEYCEIKYRHSEDKKRKILAELMK